MKKNNSINFIFFAFLIVIAMSAIVSADLISTNKAKVSFLKNSNSTSLEVTALETINLQSSYNATTIYDDAGNTLTFLMSNINLALPNGNKTIITINVVKSPDFEFELGTYSLGSITLTAVNSSNSSINQTKTIPVELISGFCKVGEVGELEIVSIEDNKDFEWEPLDKTTIEVEVENNYDKDKRVKVSLELYNSKGKKVDLGIDPKSRTINEDESEKFSFDIKVPADIDAGKYKLYVKAALSDESEGCVDNIDNDYYEVVDVSKNERDVVVDINELSKSMPFETYCNQDVSLSIPVYNTGEEDEEKVKVILKNKELNINVEKIISNLDYRDWQILDIDFVIPLNATANRTYNFDMLIYFDYSDNVYQDVNVYTVQFKVLGGCTLNIIPAVSITPALTTNQTIYSGSEVMLSVKIKNTGQARTTYSISVSDIEDWAQVKLISPQILTLEPNEESSVLVKLKLNNDIEGEKILGIKATSEGFEKIQKASLYVEESSAFRKLFGRDSWLANNWLVLLIVLVNLVLIVAIILILVKIFK